MNDCSMLPPPVQRAGTPGSRHCHADGPRSDGRAYVVGEPLRFVAVLQARGAAAAVVLTDEMVAALADGRGALPVKGTAQ